MVTKVNTPATEAEAYPTQDDFKQLLLKIAHAQSLADSTRNELYSRGKDEQYYRNTLARYLNTRDTLDVLRHQYLTMQLHLMFETMGRLKKQIEANGVALAGRPL